MTALARVTDSLRASALAMADASQGMRHGAGELETFVSGGLQATDSLGAASRAMADQGALAATASGTAAEVAAQKRAVIGEAIDRLVELNGFVSASADQVAGLGAMTSRIKGFIGTIREIADLTNLIALNAAIEAARAGRGRPRLRGGRRRGAGPRRAKPSCGAARRGCCWKRSPTRCPRCRGRWNGDARP